MLRSRPEKLWLCVALVGLVAVSPQVASAVQADDSPRTAARYQEIPGEFDGKPPGGFRSWADLLAAQKELDTAADALVRVAPRDHYGSLVVSVERNTIDLYWKGEMSAKDRRLIDAARGKVAVSIKSAEFSAAEIEGAMASIERDLARNGTPVSRISPRPDAKGVIVSVDGETAGVASLPVIANSRVHVSVDRGPRMRPAVIEVPGKTDREHDVPLYWGGALYNVAGGSCSTGFGIDYNGQGIKRILTAGHCGENGTAVSIAQSGGNQAEVGSIQSKIPNYDIALIDIPSDGRVYTGSSDSTTSAPVLGAVGTHVGDYVCTDGAMFGQRCSIQITQTDVRVQMNGGPMIQHMSIGKRSNNLPAIHAGDSGGPVLQPQYVPKFGVYAKGIISGGLHAVPCWDGAPDSQCYNEVSFQPVVNALTAYDSSILTSG
ncbi:S1 family peptidase [Streptomyces sp. NPDC085614]|uniref:S1 family peptidase n=1 Tax=Streptomyces sp. NPDC085614 TaxID=3365733 RepID=UPI0037D1CF62